MDLKNYLIPRERVSPTELRLYLLEVDNLCPICGKSLQAYKQKKDGLKLYEIAHIFPNSPTDEQMKELEGVPLLGKNSESFENKIALCLECHKTQDFHTKRTEYIKLYEIKKALLSKRIAEETLSRLNIENDIESVVRTINSSKQDQTINLKLTAVPIANKFTPEEILLRNKVLDNITRYYDILKRTFINTEGTENFNFNNFAQEIKLAYMRAQKEITDKKTIFDLLVNWLNSKTNYISTIACEIIVSYFIQDCEVFDEITK